MLPYDTYYSLPTFNFKKSYFRMQAIAFVKRLFTIAANTHIQEECLPDKALWGKTLNTSSTVVTPVVTFWAAATPKEV